MENQAEKIRSCWRCGIELESLSKMPIRTGGITGFFSGFGETSEEILTLDVFRCPRCRKLEFFDLDGSLPES